MLLPDDAFEQHYSIKDLARLWRLSAETTRQLVMNEPDVLRIQLGRKKKMCRYSIPASAARRIHRLLLEPACANGKAA